MRECREASQGTKAQRALGRRLARRMSLLVGVGMMVLFGTAQAASASNVTSVTPAEACPGEVVTFNGTGFPTGSRPETRWNDKVDLEAAFGNLEGNPEKKPI